jgi:drug/metabolite transporter (DMT)-like permease
MTAMPSISLAHPGALIAAVFTPWIALGIALLIGFFASYLTALSWADLTFVLPATAFGYVIIALLARFWLHESISLERWAGVVLITLGVGFVAQGPSLTQHPAPEAEESADQEPLEPEPAEPEPAEPEPVETKVDTR